MSALFHTLAPVWNVLPEGIRDQKAADHLLLARLLTFTDFVFFCFSTFKLKCVYDDDDGNGGYRKRWDFLNYSVRDNIQTRAW